MVQTAIPVVFRRCPTCSVISVNVNRRQIWASSSWCPPSTDSAGLTDCRQLWSRPAIQMIGGDGESNWTHALHQSHRTD